MTTVCNIFIGHIRSLGFCDPTSTVNAGYPHDVGACVRRTRQPLALLYFRVGNSLDQLLERCRRDCEQLEACACAEKDDDQQTVQEGI